MASFGTMATELQDIVSAEACEILAVDRRTLMRYVVQGRIEPTRKLPGRTGPYLFRRSDVEALAAKRAAAATSNQSPLPVAVSA